MLRERDRGHVVGRVGELGGIAFDRVVEAVG